MPGSGDVVVVDVAGMEPSEDGMAYGTIAGRRIRLDAAIPGERIEARVVHEDGGDLVGEVVRVVRASPSRVTPRCPFFGPCGGCAWQHIAYPEQLRLKQRLLEGLLKQAIGASAPAVRPPLTGGEWGFRNKVHFVLTQRGRVLALGHYRRGSQSVIEVDQCPVHVSEGNQAAFAIRDGLARARVEGATPDLRRGLARHIVVRVTGRESMATLVVTRNEKRLKTAVSAVLGGGKTPTAFALNINDKAGPYLFGEETRHLHGPRRVRERVAGISFLISPTSFFQTNVRAAEKMVHFVLEQADAAPTVLDLFAGAGLFALPLAARGARVVAVEESREAIDDGEASRRLSRIAESSCAFVRGRAEDFARGRRRLRSRGSPDLVVLDPPRAGCPPPVLEWICGALHPHRIIYVSCNPRALAEDLRVLLAAGYTLEVVQPVDMFPHTAHIETVAVLSSR